MSSALDPIAAIATAPGRGGIGIVRVSGRDLRPVIDGLLGAAAARLQARRALLTPFMDGQQRPIDEGVALLFPGPHSYTGETVLELQGHGGPVVLRLLLARCLECGRGIGLRLAEPGEFTRRAYLNDRLDLAQAEAVADLIDAGTAAAARSALRSLQGDFSRAALALAAELTELRALTEATLDFPEEEIDFLRAADAAGRLDRAMAALADVRRRATQGALQRDGLQVALLGAPNVGKSSLLNALAGAEVAIVTEHPGTTRDRVERAIEIEGLAINIIDTAGLRDTQDPIEQLGIARSHAAAAEADLVIELLDDSHPAAGVAPPAAAQLTVHNKIDLSGTPAGVRDGQVYLSARTGAGIEALRQELLRRAGYGGAAAAETVFLARERHLQALARAAEHLEGARQHAAAGTGQLELFAEALRLAAGALGEITGAVTSEDLLGQIFGRFCIGK